VIVAFSAVCGPGSPAGGQTAETDEQARVLAERYAPVMMLKTQEHPCDTDGEPFEPTAVDILLDNPQVFLRQVGTGNPVLTNGAGGRDLHPLGGGWFLDVPGDALNPGCLYEQDFRRFSAGRPPVVYAHIATQDDEPGKLALQYWFFWYYNDWNNKHEGDWEGIQLLFEVGTVEEALATEPTSVGYAQHEGGEIAGWDDDKLDRRGSHPVVFSSAGSHASYFGQALYLGRSGSEGFGCDNTDGPSRAVEPHVVVLPDAVDDPNDPLAWLAFEGRWGERQSGPFNGPTGPAMKARWTHPIDWHDELRSSSVIVPAGDAAATDLVNSFCQIVGWGSGVLVTAEQNPTVLLLVMIVGFPMIGFIVGRTDWRPVPPFPIERRRRAGQVITTSAVLLVRHPRRFVTIGLIYAPVAVAAGFVMGALRSVPLLDSALDTERSIGFLGFVLAALVGSIGHFAGLMAVTAAAAISLRDLEAGGSMTAAETFRALRQRSRDLAGALVRQFVIVGLLLVSIVGIPWGVRQLVRYQFTAPITVLEELRPQAALRRSSRLVRGRWGHTAAVVALLTELTAAFSLFVGLGILLAVPGLPLWLFSVVLSSFTMLVVPYVALSYVLLYGDAVAASTAAPAANDDVAAPASS